MIETKTTERTMKDLSLEERRQVLIDCMSMMGRDVMKKHNISKNALGHIKYYHGKSNATGNGDYHKNLLEGYIDPTHAKVKEIKERGGTSGEASRETGMKLTQVNKIWPTL